MKVALFCHSVLSDWDHGSAHFLRGVVAELRARGHRVTTYEPLDSWSARRLVGERGELPEDELASACPLLGVRSGGVRRYDPATLDLAAALDQVDLVLVHERSGPELAARLGRARARGGRFVLLFHDTHHRSITAPRELARYDLDGYDGVLAAGQAISRAYERAGSGRRVFVWHEAADVRVFHPRLAPPPIRDVCWIGDWRGDARASELWRLLIGPVRALELRATIRGMRYPAEVARALAGSGFDLRGWLPDHCLPEVFAAHRVTLHLPERSSPRERALLPSIRPFEALACGIPLISAPWDDVDGLLSAGRDYLVARSGAEMERHLRDVLSDPDLAAGLAESGLQVIRDRHTCAHRIDQLLEIHSLLTTLSLPALEVV